MNVSSVVVRIAPERAAEAARRLADLPGVEVSFTDASRGRLVVTQETETADEQEEGLRRIQALPFVLAADLVCHYADADEKGGEGS